MKKDKEERKKRLAQALKQNIQRRKKQQKNKQNARVTENRENF
ncbi:hypothetical protein [Wolbachia endosymbiont of Pentidionis agamae]